MAVSCPKPCRGCGRATKAKRGFCPECAAKRERLRGTRQQRGYDVVFLRLRRKVLIRDRFTCQQCGWKPESVAITEEAGLRLNIPAIFEELRKAHRFRRRRLEVDHIIPIEKEPSLRLVLANLQTLCSTCHSAKTARETFHP